MQPESKPSAELNDDRYEKHFGAAGRRRGLIAMGLAVIIILGAIIGITRSMSYVGGLNSQVYDAFDTSKDGNKASEAPAE